MSLSGFYLMFVVSVFLIKFLSLVFVSRVVYYPLVSRLFKWHLFIYLYPLWIFNSFRVPMNLGGVSMFRVRREGGSG